MFVIVTTICSIVALLVALTALQIKIADRACQPGTPREVRTDEVRRHYQKLCGWVLHFLAYSVPMAVFFVMLWFTYLRDAVETASFYTALTQAPPVVLFLVFVCAVYTTCCLCAGYWHLYSLSRAFRPVNEQRLRDKIQSHLSGKNLPPSREPVSTLSTLRDTWSEPATERDYKDNAA